MESWPLNVMTSRRNAWLEAMLEYVFVKRQVPSDVQEKTLLKLENLDDFIDSELENISKGQVTETDFGRLGDHHVTFDICTNVGTFIVDKDRLGVSSQSNFNTIRGTCCVFKGKWQYELMLGSKGVMQVGWVTSNCKFSQEKGVGDTQDSYAYDGNRVRKWNVSTYKYGEPWLAGDVIGCCLDLDEGTVHFYRNGRSLGVAFDRVRAGPGLVYFPAVSLAFGENLVANFGATPLRHPVEGHRPLEKLDPREAERAWTLVRWVKRLLPVYEEVQKGAVPSQYLTDGLDVFRQGTKAQALLLAAPVLRRLGPLLASSHVTEVSVLPFLFQVLDENPDGGGVSVLLELFWALLEPLEVQRCLQNVAVALLSGFRFSPCTPDLHHQKRHLSLFLSVVRHDSSRRYLLENVLFDKIKFPLFMDVKPPDNETLATVVHDVWFELMEEAHPTEEAYKKSLYAASKQKLKSVALELESLQLRILEQLTTDDDAPQGQTSRDTFLAKFEDFIKENSPGSRTVTLDLCPPSVALNFFHRLVALLRQCLPVLHAASGKLLQAHSLYIPGDVFLSDIGVRGEVSRVGDFPELPYDIASNQQSNRTDEGHKASVELSSGTPNAFDKDRASTKVFRLLDGIVRLYYLCSHAHFLKMNAVREGMRDYLRAVQEVRRNSALGEPDVVEALTKAEEVFSDTLSQQARQVAWLSAVVFSKEKQADVYWLLRVVLLTLEEASHSGAAFAFVPDYYVESCIKLLTSLSFYFPPTCNLSDIPGHYNVLVRYSTFLAQHFADPRVTNPDMKDALLRALAAHVCPPSTVRALECMPTESSMAMIQALLQPYKNRPWAQTNWILMRLWKGCGFAFRFTIAPHLVQRMSSKPVESALPSHPAPCPSVFFQNHIGRWLEDHPDRAAAFLGSVLTQLNWAFSQFISMLQEIQNAHFRPERVFVDTRQLKICATCFDLSLGLLRVVEMVVNVAPSLVTHPGRPHSDLLLARICQLVSQVLNRVTSRCGCFDLVVGMDVAGLEAVDHFPIVAAVTGILVALLLRGSVDSRENALSVLLAEPSFQQSSLEFLLGGGSNGAASLDAEDSAVPSPPLFSLANYAEVKEEEVEQVRQLVQLVQGRQAPATPLDEDQLCTICYAQGNSVRFVPCGHQSCQLCIMTHLVNNRECFFCKALIEKLDSQRPLPPH
ncbi:E3 ubiquitin-protein ligase RNF123 isoform X1 [Ixodes scapularis]